MKKKNKKNEYYFLLVNKFYQPTLIEYFNLILFELI